MGPAETDLLWPAPLDNRMGHWHAGAAKPSEGARGTPPRPARHPGRRLTELRASEGGSSECSLRAAKLFRGSKNVGSARHVQ
jgi:hypothetical protein